MVKKKSAPRSSGSNADTSAYSALVERAKNNPVLAWCGILVLAVGTFLSIIKPTWDIYKSWQANTAPEFRYAREVANEYFLLLPGEFESEKAARDHRDNLLLLAQDIAEYYAVYSRIGIIRCLRRTRLCICSQSPAKENGSLASTFTMDKGVMLACTLHCRDCRKTQIWWHMRSKTDQTQRGESYFLV